MKSMYRILIIDDDQAILDMLKLQLEWENYLVDTAVNGKEALNKLTSTPDLILLDIQMEGMSGLELCQKIRQYVSVPIIFLTAKVTQEDKINGFIAGGDDYITKPFAIDELLIRISAHLRREERSRTKMKIRFSKEMIIDYLERSVYINEQRLDFSQKEFEIIQLLSMNAGQVFDREKIYQQIWGIDGQGDNTVVKEHIRKIREKIAVWSDEPYITTVWGIGYKWEK